MVYLLSFFKFCKRRYCSFHRAWNQNISVNWQIRRVGSDVAIPWVWRNKAGRRGYSLIMSPRGGYSTSSLREIMWQPRTKTQVNKGKALKPPMRPPQGRWLREGQEHWARRPAGEQRVCFNKQRPLVQIDNLMRPSAIHHADLVCSGKAAVNHREQRLCQLIILITHHACLCLWALYTSEGSVYILKGQKQGFNW